MQKFLIPLVACLILMAAPLYAQVPESVSVPFPVKPASKFKGNSSPDMVCNFAGTYQLGQFIGNSNDITLDTIYLCEGDSIFIDHDGNWNLAGDPIPATQAGVGWAFYECPPYISGDSLSAIVLDSCLLPGGPNGIWVYTDQQNGDAWFYNDGSLQANFNAGDPYTLFFAPITLDILDATVMPSVQGFETNNPAVSAGPCVNVNVAEAFAIVYLNPIFESGISTNFGGNDCLGKFRLEGGYPEFDPTGTYTVNITLLGNPGVSAEIHNPSNSLFDGVDVIFSAPQAGVYEVTVSDGKSCPYSFQIAMGACDVTDNVVLTLPDEIAPPGATNVCLPVTVENFSIISGSFSVTWDPAVIEFVNVADLAPEVGGFGPSNFNTAQTNLGLLGVTVYDQINLGNVITLAPSDTLFSLCFNVIGALGECSPLDFQSTPTLIAMEDDMGNPLAVSTIDGEICIGFQPLTVDVNVVNANCLGQAAIQVVVEGGITPYEVEITTLPSGSPTYFGIVNNSGGNFTTPIIPAGSFSIRVIENGGNGPDTITQALTFEIPILGASLDLNQLPLCFGDSTGAVEAMVFVGTTPAPDPGIYTYTWDPLQANNVSAISGVPAGPYSVTVTDPGTGCTAVAAGTLGQPTPISEQSITVTDAACTGISDGSIEFLAEGGNPFPDGSYIYNWTYSPDGDPLNVFQDETGQSNPIILSNKPSGTYYVTITDANGCTFVYSSGVEIRDTRALTLTVTAQDVSCFGGSDGSVCVEVVETPPSGAPSFSFVWTGTGNQVDSTIQLFSCYTDLAPGAYDVFAIDAVGCIVTASSTVGEPTPVVLGLVGIQQPTCAFPNNGRIEVAASGGAGGADPANFTYNWSNGATGRVQSNLPPGVYCVTATDASGCVDSLCDTILLPLPPVLTALDSVSVKCGNDGCLTVTTNPVGAIYTWLDIDGTPVTGGNAAQVCGLNGGDYVVFVQDSGGCVLIDTFTLASVPPIVIFDTTILEPSCFGVADGSIALGVDGGNPGYTVTWTPGGQTGLVLTNAAAGFYTVNITDSEGCVFSTELELTGPPEIQLTFSAAGTVSVSCFGVCDGQAVPLVQYADGTSGNFDFLWQDGSVDSTRNDLCAGVNLVTVTDALGCFDTASVNVPTPQAVGVTGVQIEDVTCFGDSDGSALVNGAGGNGSPYTFQWSPNAGTNVTGSFAQNLAADVYVVTVTDQDGCTGTASVTVGSPGEILIAVDPALTLNPTCFNETDGALGVTVSGGNGNYSFLWLDQDSMLIGNTNPITNLDCQAYDLVVTDASGCTGEFQGALTCPPPFVGILAPLDEILCNGDLIQLTVDTITGGSGGPFQFSVDFGVTVDPGFPVPVGGGVHYITYFEGLNQQCSYTDTIDIPQPNPISVNFNPATIPIELGESLVLEPQLFNVVQVDSFIWSPSDRLLNPDTLNPTLYTFESGEIFLTVFDQNGCSGTGSVIVEVDANRNVFIPNVFKPGSESGLNDHFAPWIGLGVERVNFMKVYDRWGEQVYDIGTFVPENQPYEGWDGRYQGKYVNPGVFIYVIEVVFLDSRVLLYRGDVTVIR